MIPLALVVLAFTQLPLLMFLAGCGMLVLILLRRSHRYFGRRSSDSSSSLPVALQPRPTSKWSGVERDALARIDREQVDLYDMKREIEGQLNSKIVILEQLIETNQRQLERIEQLLGAAEEQTGMSSN